MIVTLIVFILILGLLIFVHEFGHFITAKRSGIKVEEFAFGFPPRIFAVKKGETEYALNLFPIGGYVKMLGEEEDASANDKKNERSFAHQSVWTRSKVVVAGVLMNVVLAWLLIAIGFMVGMSPVVTEPEKIPNATVIRAVGISAVAENSAAQAAGLKPGDHVLEFNGQIITTTEKLANLTKENKGQAFTLDIARNGNRQTVSGTLGTNDGPLGVRLAEDVTVKLPFFTAIFYSMWETIKAVGLIFVGILDFFRQLFVTRQIPAEAAGPVGIFYYTKTVIDLGIGALLNFVAVLSINLAVINIMPIPALDGGRLLFILLEKFNHGRKVLNQKIENTAHAVGFFLLIILIISITVNDVLKLGS
jgi:regulator of sigma E protease